MKNYNSFIIFGLKVAFLAYAFLLSTGFAQSVQRENISELDFKIEAPNTITKDDLVIFDKNQEIIIRIVATNNDPDTFPFLFRSPFHQNRLKLMNSDKVLCYKKEVAEKINFLDQDDSRGFKTLIRIQPGNSELVQTIKLSEWYGPLDKGDYALSVEYRSTNREQYMYVGNLFFKIE